MREENIAALQQGGTTEDEIGARRALHGDLLAIAWEADMHNDTGSRARRSNLSRIARHARRYAGAVETLQGLDVDYYTGLANDLRAQCNAEIGGY